ncbi:hypothetical protein DBB29_13145 [Pandoraea cepalis]|uniref:Uncharacterized protein n=1 Tax=Pandoraea cepalis TaxID=2508294 RepID=A0AAW7MR60_9BURK|nr:hypothetical protein [Pandoraea cepalis]MDN4579061.1 hypothetical protein [Pandoraea cepalis]
MSPARPRPRQVRKRRQPRETGRPACIEGGAITTTLVTRVLATRLHSVEIARRMSDAQRRPAYRDNIAVRMRSR